MAIYRLILGYKPGDPGYRTEFPKVNTGATYPGCSRTNTTACKPIQFENEAAAVRYARLHNEVPVRMESIEQTWDIVEGRLSIREDQIIQGAGSTGGVGIMEGINLPLVIGGLAVLWFVFRR